MLRNKRFWGFLLILCLILIPMSVYQHAGSDVVEHHGFLFLAMELLLLLQILPEVNEQRLVRMSRREHWRKTWAAMGISAFAFSTLFSLIQFFMTLILLTRPLCCGPDLLQYPFCFLSEFSVCIWWRTESLVFYM